MSLITNDKYWSDTASFLEGKIKQNDKIFAPKEFSEKFTNLFDYLSSYTKQNLDYQWFVVHKGLLIDIELNFLNQIHQKLKPVFANEVFVIYSSYQQYSQLDNNNVHVKAYIEKIKILNQSFINCNTSKKEQISQTILEPNKQSNRQNLIEKQIDYSSLSVDKIKDLMEQRYKDNNAYNVIHLWDSVRAEELARRVIEHINSTENKTILEIGCGSGGSAAYIDDCKEFIGTDLSEEAVAQAKDKFKHKRNFDFIAMDAMNLPYKDNTFDVFIAKEVIEHLPNPEKAIKEAHRVLKPNGVLVVTSPNRDSLHLRVNRMLGYQDFKCSFDHVKEFTFQEAVAMLTQQGFVIKNTGGVFCQPYWGIPGIDSSVRQLTDNDGDMVEMLRDLGERVGAEYAFCFVISCYKPN